MAAIDWATAFAGFDGRLLNNPPYLVLKGVDKPPDRLARTAGELSYYLHRNVRLQHWLKYKADDPSFRPVRTRHWPDSLEEWGEEIEKLVNDGTAPHEVAAHEWLYANNEEFKFDADEGFKIEEACDKKWRQKWLFWKFNRAAWTAVWVLRIARKTESAARE